MAAISQMR